MKNKKAKLLSILLSLSMLGTAPVYGEDFSDFSDNLVASDEADPEVSVSSDDTSQDSFQIRILPTKTAASFPMQRRKPQVILHLMNPISMSRDFQMGRCRRKKLRIRR